jgi:hypothetical protein
MEASRTVNLRFIVVIAFTYIVALGMLGLAAANTASTSQAGGETYAISSLAISSLDYTLNEEDPSKVDSVEFTIAQVTGNIKVRIDGSWYSCASANGAVTCDTSSPAASVDGVPGLQAITTN